MTIYQKSLHDYFVGLGAKHVGTYSNGSEKYVAHDRTILVEADGTTNHKYFNGPSKVYKGLKSEIEESELERSRR